MKRWLGFIVIFLLSSQLWAQNLFEDAVSSDSEDTETAQPIYELNGYMRGVFYGGKVYEKDEAELKSGYGEAVLKLRVRKQEFGDGYAEIRFRRGNEFGDYVSEFNLREAYINSYVGRFDFRLGHQIVVWGRADGFNPTNNITPQNRLVRSPNEDDYREGNFLVRSFYNIHPFRLEAIWVPTFSPSVLPIRYAPLPHGLSLTDPDYPDANLKNSAFAAKLDLELSSFDGSVSYFNGYNPYPGIDATMLDITKIEVMEKSYKMHIMGADFSTTWGSFGLRGEFAYRKPVEDYEKHIYIPNPDLQYTIGVDKELGDFNIILQYVGRYVFDFKELSEPVTPVPEQLINYEMALNNRMFAMQRDEISHAISFRPAWKLMYETLNLEMLGLYYFKTEELFIRPKICYDITDALELTLGGDIYTGADDSLYGMTDEILNAFFIELKTSF